MEIHCRECGTEIYFVYGIRPKSYCPDHFCKDCIKEIKADFEFDQRRDDKMTGDDRE